jgi:hypothetical protein
LIAHAEANYRLDRLRPDGTTLRQHLLTVRRATGKTPPELEIPALPHCVAFVWDAFDQISMARGGNYKEPQPVSWQDLAAWQHLSGIPLTPWEAETIIHLDRAARTVLAGG